MSIALIGPPGVGKGTQASRLVEKFDLMHLVTGELLRDNLENRTPIGFLTQRYMAQGKLVPDEVIEATVAAWLWHANPDRSVLFNGFPRTLSQAQFLDDFLETLGRQLDAAIYLKITDESVKRRLTGRLICQNCHQPYHLRYNPPEQNGQCDKCGGQLQRRPDDIPEMIQVRLRAFRQVIRPTLDYYQQSNRLVIIDADNTLDAVSDAVFSAVEAIYRRESTPATEEDIAQIHALPFRPLSKDEATHQSRDLVLVGGPGSGKGTQAHYLSALLTLPHIASGDLFREHLKQESDLGQLAKSYMDKGDLVPDDVTEAMVEDRLTRDDASAGFILDGFPRTLSQAHALTEMMNMMRRRLDMVLFIRVSDDEIVRRLSGRLICRNCQTPYHRDFNPPAEEGVCDKCGGELYQRDDDNPKTVRARLQTFHTQTAPILAYYRNLGLLVEINGEGEVSAVKAQMREATASLLE